MFQWTNAWIGAKIHILLPAHRRRRPILLCHPIHPDQFYRAPSDHANAPADAQLLLWRANMEEVNAWGSANANMARRVIHAR